MDSNYIPVNLGYPGLKPLRQSPPLYLIKDFLTPEECIILIRSAESCLIPSPVVGDGDGEPSPQRTSETSFLKREDVPTLITRVSNMLLGKNVHHIELPQVGRYLSGQEYKVVNDYDFNMNILRSKARYRHIMMHLILTKKMGKGLRLMVDNAYVQC